MDADVREVVAVEAGRRAELGEVFEGQAQRLGEDELRLLAPGDRAPGEGVERVDVAGQARALRARRRSPRRVASDQPHPVAGAAGVGVGRPAASTTGRRYASGRRPVARRGDVVGARPQMAVRRDEVVEGELAPMHEPAVGAHPAEHRLDRTQELRRLARASIAPTVSSDRSRLVATNAARGRDARTPAYRYAGPLRVGGTRRRAGVRATRSIRSISARERGQLCEITLDPSEGADRDVAQRLAQRTRSPLRRSRPRRGGRIRRRSSASGT